MRKYIMSLMSALTLSIAIAAHTHTDFQTTKKLTATESYLTIKPLRDQVATQFNDPFGPQSPYKNLITTMLERERMYASTHYVFYHGQSGNYRLVQDLMNVIEHAHYKKPQKNDFVYLRNWSNEKIFDSQLLDIHTFIDTVERIVGSRFNDAMPLLSENLLSVNLSLFGNSQHLEYLESSFDYFMSNRSGFSDNVEHIIKSIVQENHFEVRHVPHLLALNQKYHKSGNLIQIFIPKDNVDQCVYLSHSRSTPYRKIIIDEIFDQKKNRHMCIAPILDRYLEQPHLIDNIDALQARILLPSLHTITDVKMFRYGNDDHTEDYYAELHDLFGFMV